MTIPMSDFTAVIWITPRGKGRPRMTRRGRAYTDPLTKASEAQIRSQLSKQLGDLEPITAEPLHLECDFYFARPKSVKHSKRHFPIVKPDLDNLVKLLKDAGNKLVWMDDAIICQLTARKFYDDLNLGERIELRVSLLDQSGSAAGNAGLGLICSETCVTQAS